MSIKVKFFAHLREELGINNLVLEEATFTNVRSVWCTATKRPEVPNNIFCAINHEHAELTDPVQNGDEIAFFPRITGG